MIKILNLSKYFGNLCILKNINLTIPQGSSIAILGSSGSGKSTFLRCINFIEQPTEGTIMINNEIISTDNILMIRQKIGMVFQNFSLFPHMTVLENIIYAPMNLLKYKKEKAIDLAESLLKSIKLESKKDCYPTTLSGGQQQRVAIARTLAMSPDIILFDEPTSALDPESIKEILELIKSLFRNNITIIIVTHEIKIARFISKRILFFNEGLIVEDALTEEFFTNPQSEFVKNFLKKIL